jgi:hypothetical protein
MDDNRACHIRSFNFEEVASLFTGVRGIGILRTSPFGQSAKFATLCNAPATPNIRYIDVAPSFATIHTCSLLRNERSETDESRPSLLWKECASGVEDKLTEVP